jgi:hypothetical protein
MTHIGQLIIMVTLITALFVAINTQAAPASTITIDCVAPTHREPVMPGVAGVPIAPTELATYEYRRNGAGIGAGPAPCTHIYTIPAGQCVRKAEVFSVRVIDTDGRASAWALSKPISQDYCAAAPPTTTPAASRAPTINRLIAR